jgi:glycosyltransferase involved in cell wall biosynthesis
VVRGDFVFAIPGDLDTPTGGYAYDRRMLAELRELGWRPEVLGLGDGFPRPSALIKAAAKAHLADVPKGWPIVIDGLAFGVLPEAAQVLRDTHPLIALVHHPLALETGVAADDAVTLRISERAALACTRGVIVTSPATARTLVGEFGVPAERITVAEPGTDRVAQVRRKQTGAVALLAVGAVVPRKGYDVLIDALAGLIDLPWRLTIVGDCARHPPTLARLKDDIEHHRLGPRVAIEDAVSDERLTALYAASDVFVLASHYEGFGMAYAEAIAHGLPVVGTTGGAIPDTVPASAGVLVPPGDAAALAATLRHLIEDTAARDRLAAGARAAAERLPTWQGSAERFSQAIERVI